MNMPAIVCPFDTSLLSRLGGRTVAITVDRPEHVSEASQACSDAGCTLKCVRLHVDSPLAAVPFTDEWLTIPLAVSVPAAGRVRELSPRLALLRSMRMYVYLRSTETQALTDARILSSLGLAVVVEIGGATADWDLLADLATYAVLGRSSHGPIEPFASLAGSYSPTEWNDCGTVYFDHPGHYLHIDRAGKVALSAADRAAGAWVADDVCAYIDSGRWVDAGRPMQRYGDRFETLNECSRCPGWRVCLGRFRGESAPETTCRPFAVELMELVEQYQERRQPAENLWQH